MINFPYVIPLEPKRYIPLYIRCNSLTLICGLMGQFNVTYGIQRLSGVPFREDDLDIQWEQLTGPEPLEFSDWRGLNPSIMVSPDVIQDMTFRVWLDKGKKDAKYADVGVYRTPVSFLNSDLNVTGNVSASTNNLNSTNNSLRSQNDMPVITGILPVVGEGRVDALIDEYLIYYELSALFKSYGHKLIKATLKSSRGVILEEFTEFDGSGVLKLSKYVPQFYIVWEFAPYAEKRGIIRPNVVIQDAKLHQIPLDFYTNSKIVNYVFKDTLNIGRINPSAELNQRSLTVALPNILIYLDTPMNVFMGSVISKSSTSKLTFKGASYSLTESSTLNVIYSAVLSNVISKTVNRFNDIIIGG